MAQGIFRRVESCSVGKEIRRLLPNPKVHYRVHKSPSLVLTLGQQNIVSTITPYSFKIQFNIILLSTSMFAKWSPVFKFPG